MLGGAKKKAIVGVDIGSQCLKLVSLQKGSEGYTLRAFHIKDLGEPLGSLEGSTEVWGEVLKDMVDEAGVRGRETSCAVAGQSVVVRYIELPKMEKAELKNAIKFEAEQYIPFPIDEVYVDFHILANAPVSDPRRMKVLLVAARKELINALLQIFQKAGLRLVAIDVQSFALVNAFETFGPKVDEQVSVALVDIGAKITKIHIIKNRLSFFCRDIAIGGANLTSAIAQHLNVDFKEAEHIKKEEGDAAEVNRISDALLPVLEDLAGELRLSFDYYENQSFEASVEKMYISGGGAMLKNLDKFLAQTLGVETSLWDPTQRLILNGQPGAQDIKDFVHLIPIGLGLAVRGV